MLLEIAALVADAVRMLQPAEKSDLLEDVLPLLERLLAPVAHLLDGHHLGGDVVAGVVDGSEAAVANLAEVVEQLVRVLALKELSDVRVLQAPRSRERKKIRESQTLARSHDRNKERWDR